MVKSTGRSSSGHHPKRYGRHQRQTKPFLKTYLPYLPLLTILVTGVFLSSTQPTRPTQTHNGVLAYATSVSENDLLAETNAERIANKEPALKLNDKLIKAAQDKAADMVARNYWSHTTPDGSQPWVFLDRAGYDYQKAGENLAYGFASSKATITGWMNSPSHKANLLDKGFDEVGFGYADARNYQGTGASTVVVAMYGRSQASAAGANSYTPVTTSSQAVRGDQTITNFADAHTYRVARIQIITNGNAPWSIWVIAVLALAGLAFIVVKHSLKVRRAVFKGEKFVLTHPLFDVTLIALIVLCVYVSHAEGYILSASI